MITESRLIKIPVFNREQTVKGGKGEKKEKREGEMRGRVRPYFRPPSLTSSNVLRVLPSSRIAFIVI